MIPYIMDIILLTLELIHIRCARIMVMPHKIQEVDHDKELASELVLERSRWSLERDRVPAVTFIVRDACYVMDSWIASACTEVCVHE